MDIWEPTMMEFIDYINIINPKPEGSNNSDKEVGYDRRFLLALQAVSKNGRTRVSGLQKGDDSADCVRRQDVLHEENS